MSDNDEVLNTEVAPVESPEEIKESTPPEENTTNSEDENSQSESKPEKTFTQKELDDILQRRLAKEQRKIERYARAEAERDQLRAQLEQFTRPVQQSSGMPEPSQFQTYEEYIDALTDWKLDRKLEQKREQEARQTQMTAQQQYEETLKDNIVKAAEKYDDFEDVITNPRLNITLAMRDAIGESDVGGEIAYYLGTNLKEADAIAKMTPVKQIKAIDALEAKFKASPQVSKAPAPLDPVGKGRTKTEPDLSKMSVAEYAEYRKKNGARWAR